MSRPRHHLPDAALPVAPAAPLDPELRADEAAGRAGKSASAKEAQRAGARNSQAASDDAAPLADAMAEEPVAAALLAVNVERVSARQTREGSETALTDRRNGDRRELSYDRGDGSSISGGSCRYAPDQRRSRHDHRAILTNGSSGGGADLESARLAEQLAGEVVEHTPAVQERDQ